MCSRTGWRPVLTARLSCVYCAVSRASFTCSASLAGPRPTEPADAVSVVHPTGRDFIPNRACARSEDEFAGRRSRPSDVYLSFLSRAAWLHQAFCGIRGQPDFARPSANPIRGLPGFARHSANPDDGRWRVFVAPPIRRRLGSRRPTTCRDTGCCLSPWDTGGVDRPVIRHIFQLWGLAGVKVLARSDPTRRPGPGLWAHVRGVVGPGSRGRGFCRSCSALAAESEAGCPPAP